MHNLRTLPQPYPTLWLVSESLTPNTPSRPLVTNSFPYCKERIPTVKLDSTVPQQGQGWNPLNLSWPDLIYCSTLTCRDPVRCLNSCSASAPTFHGCLERVDGIDFSDDDSGSEAPQGLGAALAHVPISCHHCHLPSNHDICGTLDAIDEGLSAAIKVIKLALRKEREPFQNRWKPLKWNFLRERKWTYVQLLRESLKYFNHHEGQEEEKLVWCFYLSSFNLELYQRQASTWWEAFHKFHCVYWPGLGLIKNFLAVT